MDDKGLTKRQFFFNIAAISVKTIRSIGFNVVMMVFGYIMGFGTMHLITQMAWTRNQNYECVQRLEQCLDQQRDLDDKIDKQIRELKSSIVRQQKDLKL